MARRFIRSSRGLGAQDVRWTSALHGSEWNGDLPQQAKMHRYIPAHCLPICKTRNEGENKTMENVASYYKFYRIPKRFFKEEQFRDMTNAAQVLYGILLDRKCLSDSNGDAWRDEFGITYIIFTIEEISTYLGISEKTVRNHISNVMQKMNVKGRSGAIIELLKLGEINL